LLRMMSACAVVTVLFSVLVDPVASARIRREGKKLATNVYGELGELATDDFSSFMELSSELSAQSFWFGKYDNLVQFITASKTYAGYKEKLHNAVTSSITPEDEPEGESLKEDAKLVLTNALDSVGLSDVVSYDKSEVLEETPRLYHYLELFLSQVTEYLIEKSDVQEKIKEFYFSIKGDFEKYNDDAIFSHGGLDFNSHMDVVGMLEEHLQEEMEPKVDAACDLIVPEESDPGVGVSVGIFLEMKIPMNSLCKSFFQSVASDSIKSLLAFAGNFVQEYSTGKATYASFDGLVELVQGKYGYEPEEGKEKEAQPNKNALVAVVKRALSCKNSPATNADGWIEESCEQAAMPEEYTEDLWTAMHDGKSQKEWEFFQKLKLKELHRVTNLDGVAVAGISQLAGYLVWLTQPDIREPFLKREIARTALRFFAAIVDKHSFEDKGIPYSCGLEKTAPEDTPKRDEIWKCDNWNYKIDTAEKCDNSFMKKISNGNRLPCVWVPARGAVYPNPKPQPKYDENAPEKEKLKMLKAKKNYKHNFPISYTTESVGDGPDKTYKVVWKVNAPREEKDFKVDPKILENIRLSKKGRCVPHTGYVCKRDPPIPCDDKPNQLAFCKPVEGYRTIEECNSSTQHGIGHAEYTPCYCKEEHEDGKRCEKCRANYDQMCEKFEQGSLQEDTLCDPNRRTDHVKRCKDAKAGKLNGKEVTQKEQCEKSYKLKERDYQKKENILLMQPCMWDDENKKCHALKGQQRQTCALRPCTATAWSSYKDRTSSSKGCGLVNQYQKSLLKLKGKLFHTSKEARKTACEMSGFMAKNGDITLGHQCHWDEKLSRCEARGSNKHLGFINWDISPHCKRNAKQVGPKSKGFASISIKEQVPSFLAEHKKLEDQKEDEDEKKQNAKKGNVKPTKKKKKKKKSWWSRF